MQKSFLDYYGESIVKQKQPHVFLNFAKQKREPRFAGSRFS